MTKPTKDTPPAASPGGEGRNARQEVSPQILVVGAANPGGNPTPIVVQNRSLTPEELTAIRAEQMPEVRVVSDAPEKKELSEAQLEQLEAEERFMKSALEATAQSPHDDECPTRKGKECGCRDNVRQVRAGKLKVLETVRQTYAVVIPVSADGTARMGQKTVELVRVDEGRTVTKMVPDPISAQNKPIPISVFEPPRWVCMSCSSAMRGTDIDHRCDETTLRKATEPMGLERTLPPDVKFGGGYRLTMWRDRAGEYHLGEEVIAGDRVVEERHLAGPEAWNVIEGAMLDFAVRKLSA